MPNSPKVERKLAAIMFTDIVGFTKLSADDQSMASSLLKQQRELLRPIVESFNGLWIKEIGDGLLLIFDTVTDAVKCSIEIQEKTKNVDNLDLRIGIHLGEILLEENDVIGDDVNIASRIEPFSATGGIAISNKVNDAIVREKDFETEYIGKPKLKGVSQEVKVYCITSHGLPKTDLSQVSAKLEKEKSKFNIFTLTGGVLTTIGIAFWLYVSIFNVSIADESEVPSVAILPLDNKGVAEDDFYAYGISSDLISDVASAGLIRVASLNKIEDLGDISAEEKADKLDVRYIAEGSLWRRDSIFQLSMELYDTHLEKVVWSQRWQKNWTDISGIRAELAQNILEKLKVEQRDDGPSYVANPEAYEYYLKAKHKFEKNKNSDETELAKGLLEKAIEIDQNLIVAKILFGSIFVSQKNFDKAKQIYSIALKQAEELGDKLWIGRSIRRLGNVAYYNGDNNKALENFEASLAIAEELNDKEGAAHCINNIGTLSHRRGDTDKALEYYEKSLLLYTELDNKGSIGQTFNNIAGVYKKNGNLDNALEYYEMSFEKFNEIDDQNSASTILSNIGKVYKYLGDFHKSIDYYKRIFSIYENLGNRNNMDGALQYIGWAYFTMGMIDESIEYYNKALPIAEELKDKEGLAWLFLKLGLCQFYNDSYVKALEFFEKSSHFQIEFSGEVNSVIKIFIPLTKKLLNKEYNEEEILSLVQDEEKIRNYYIDYFGLYKLLENKIYIEKAYNDIQRKADLLKDEFKEKYLNYPVQKQIIEEYNKVFS